MKLKLKLLVPGKNVDQCIQATESAQKMKRKKAILQKYILILQIFLSILQKMKSLIHKKKNTSACDVLIKNL